MATKEKPSKIGALGITGIVLVGFFTYQCTRVSSSPSPNPPASSSPTATAAASTTPSAAAGPKWRYESYKDEMSSAVIKTATVLSNDSLNLEFPYSGKNMGSITIRRNPKTLDVFVAVQKGQIVCGIQECTIKVRFDERKAMNFAATGPSDHSSDTLFLAPSSKFVDLAKASKKIRVELNMFQAGTQVLVFDSAGLNFK
ncbi:MAG TPA: hypothetical protein VGC21_10240 [Telluria sp.]